MNRKKFFTTAGVSAIGLLLVKLSPVNFFRKNHPVSSQVKVRLNSESISRRKTGTRNV